MTELTFAKQFLSTLDARPTKLQPDHVSNPKTLEIHAPYTLPRMPQPMKKPSIASSSTSQNASSSVNITIKSSRNPQMELKLPDIDVGETSVLELKERIAKETAVEGIEKIKVLWERKPISDSKTIKEVIGEEGIGKGEVEFGVMIMGYTAPAPASTAGALMVAAGDKMDVDGDTTAAKGPVGDDTLGGEEFWRDLRGFLQQRLKDESLGEDAFRVFRDAWSRR